MLSALVLICVIAIPLWLVGGYAPSNFSLHSTLGSSLRVFQYNQSKHPSDIVPHCWYDSGDYLVFIQRNTQSVYYLSLAYRFAKGPEVRQDLLSVIRPQLGCIDQMLARDIKQFRDDRSHGIMVPPIMSDLTAPQAMYSFNPGEGRDVYLLRALIAQTLGDPDVKDWRDKASRLTSVTKSAHCCEEGPIKLTDTDWKGLQVLAGDNLIDHPYGWSIDYSSIAALEEGHRDRLKRMLEDIQAKWQNGPDPFAYIGGNYDIAGAVALERWYTRVFNDPSFHGLSDSFMAYLHGQNAYRVDFTHVSTIYHPCGTWWGFCDLRETLVNGVDESRIFNTKRADRWRIEEIQLVGQAKYVLARVLYEGL